MIVIAAAACFFLILDTDEGAHFPLRLAIVGPEPLGVETVASFHHTGEGRAAADKVALPILRTLQIVEWTQPGGVA